MARQPGLNNFAGTLEVLAGGPLDARCVVPAKSDLTTSGTFPYAYVGMIVSVEAEGKAYILTDLDYTDTDNWTEIGSGSGGSDNVVEGYFNSADNLFYGAKDGTTYSEPITGASGVIYVAVDTNVTYRFSDPIFVRLDYEFYESIQKDTMPTADATLENKVYQYIGVDTPDFKNGYFYKCVDNSGTFEWTQLDTQPVEDPIQKSALPSPVAALDGKVYQYVGTTSGDTIKGYFYICQENPTTEEYEWVQLEVQPDEDTKIQVVTMPAVTSVDEGRVVQYIGATAGNYVNGYFYKCIEDPDNAGSYIWIQKNIQPDNDTNIQVDTMPSPVAILDGRIVQYIGASDNTYTQGFFYICKEDSATPGTYVWSQLEVQPDNDSTIQVSSMPTVTSADEGRIVQYIGATDTDYTNGYFYKCVEDSETPNTFIWEAVNVQAGGSGSGSLQKAITAAIEVGGIEVGDNFAVGTSYDDMWDALLNPTLFPTFTPPSASLSYTADTYYEVGTSIAAKTGTVTLNRGAITPAYGTSGYRAGAATGYALASSGADTEYSSSNTTGSFSVSALTRSTKGNIVLTATASYAAGEQPKDSKGNNYDSPLPAGSKTASKTMQFILPYYYGKSSTPTVSSFTGLTKSVTAKGQKQFKFTTNNEYMVFAYDKSYGNLSSILDPNSFEVLSGWTKNTLTVGGFDYYVYVANSATTDTNAQFTFKY